MMKRVLDLLSILGGERGLRLLGRHFFISLAFILPEPDSFAIAENSSMGFVNPHDESHWFAGQFRHVPPIAVLGNSEQIADPVPNHAALVHVMKGVVIVHAPDREARVVLLLVSRVDLFPMALSLLIFTIDIRDDTAVLSIADSVNHLAGAPGG